MQMIINRIEKQIKKDDLKSDKKKLRDFALILQKIRLPKVETEEAEKVLSGAIFYIERAINTLCNKDNYEMVEAEFPEVE